MSVLISSEIEGNSQVELRLSSFAADLADAPSLKSAPHSVFARFATVQIADMRRELTTLAFQKVFGSEKLLDPLLEQVRELPKAGRVFHSAFFELQQAWEPRTRG